MKTSERPSSHCFSFAPVTYIAPHCFLYQQKFETMVERIAL